MTRRKLNPSVNFEYDEKRIDDYFNSLVIDEIDILTKERMQEIVSVANIHLESNRSKWSNLSIKEKFYLITTKIMTSRNNEFYYGASIIQEKFQPLIFQSDLEKLFLIVSYCDPENFLMKNWNQVKQCFLQDEEMVLSASNYLKARNTMKSYFDGFFNIKLILAEEKFSSMIEKTDILTTQKK